MKRIVLGLWSLLLMMGAASALQQSQIPSKFGITWASAAASAYIRSIPQGSQIGIQNCAASLHDGFPPLTFTPVGVGGCPPFGQDFNGIFNQVTAWNQWQSAGGPVFYDSVFSTSIGGYPKGALLQSAVLAGRLWFNTSDNNTTNPDAADGSAANWIVPTGSNGAGTPIPAFSTVIPPGQVPANGRTVGNASSNATARANADTYWLFSFLWTNCASCQIFNSAGSVTTKGATFIADFAANKAMATINMNGTGLIGADQNGSTLLSGVPVISGSSTVPGSIVGNNLQSLVASQIPNLGSIGTGSGTATVLSSLSDVVFGTIGTANAATTPNPGVVTLVSPGGLGTTQISSSGSASITSVSVTSSGTGGSSPTHPNVQRSVVTFWNLSL